MKKRLSSVFAGTLILAIIIGMFFLYWNKKVDLQKETSVKNTSTVGKLLNKDLEANYPATPKEVVKTYSDMLESLYSGISDKEIDALARKILILYDDEFLNNNPEDKYLKDLYSEIAAWNKDKKTISNYLIVGKDKEIKKELDGKEYAIAYASYTILQKGKTVEVRRYLLRKSDDGKWKILGWDTVPEDEVTSGESQ